MIRIWYYRGWGFDKYSFSGVMGMEVRLEWVKEKVWGEQVQIVLRDSFFNRCCCEGQIINEVAIIGDVEVQRGIFKIRDKSILYVDASNRVERKKWMNQEKENNCRRKYFKKVRGDGIQGLQFFFWFRRYRDSFYS